MKLLRLDSRKSLERGLNFFTVQQRVCFRSQWWDWPVLYVHRDDPGGLHCTPSRILFKYFYDNSRRSHEWRRQTAVAIGLFLDFTIAYRDRVKRRDMAEFDLEAEAFTAFPHALYSGTVDQKSSKRTDALGLYWPRRSGPQAESYLRRLVGFYRFCEGTLFHSRPIMSNLLERSGRDPEAMRGFAAEASVRQSKSLLSHLPRVARKPSHYAHGIFDIRPFRTQPIFSFPAKHVPEFLETCFRNSRGETDYTAELLAHLLFAGGVRKSEPFHLFVSDVQFLAEEPVVYLHHPVYGEVVDPVSCRRIKRHEYLETFGLKPRCLLRTAEQAGWKGLLGEIPGTPVHWLPIPHLVERTRLLLEQYVSIIRPRIMRSRPRHLRDHPFLLVSSGARQFHNGRSSGDPYTISAFRETWKSAVARLQQKHPSEDLDYRKGNGTTEHSARHYYGRYLRSLELPREAIQQCLHHTSLDSQNIYTSFTSAEINSILRSFSENGHRRLDP